MLHQKKKDFTRDGAEVATHYVVQKYDNLQDLHFKRSDLHLLSQRTSLVEHTWARSRECGPALHTTVTFAAALWQHAGLLAYKSVCLNR